MPYSEYLMSRWWQNRRRQKIKSVGDKCERCGADLGLQVHHLSYDRLWGEKNADLEVLCGDCHEHEHADLIEAREHMAAIAGEVRYAL